jgi:hypothetical protein
VPNVPLGQKSFWIYPMVLQVTRLKQKLVSVRLEIVLILAQERCMVCAERTIGSEIFLDTPDIIPK